MARRRNSSKPEDQRKKLLSAYLAFFDSDNGKIVLADLKATYHDRAAVSIDFDPHRALVADGCRSVYLGILAMIREAKKDAAGNDDSRAQFDTGFDLDAELERSRIDFE